ncbi:MAG: hypothetical protein ACK5KT_00595 [Dysgonomonas sp.]
MNNKFHHLSGLTIVSLVAIISFCSILLMSCNEDESENEIKDPHKKEGIIKLYMNNEEILFPEIVEYPFVKNSTNKPGLDTIGFSYTGYLNKSHSIIGSIQIIILHNNMELNYVEYRYPISNIAAVGYSRWSDDIDSMNPLQYDIKEEVNNIKGFFKGNLYSGASFQEQPEYLAIDSCSFYINK